MVGEARNPSRDTGPLEGVTVLDASRVLAGPFCTMQLADLGADVIKVERPDGGDQTRGWTPPTYGDSTESAYFLSINRNKRSITLDLKTDSGQAVFADLAREADVLVENFRAGTLEEWGLGYEELRADNPGLVYTKLTGYGEWGPDRDRPAYDIVVQAEGGMMSITGPETGDPVRVGVAVADLAAGMYASQATLAALLERELGDGTGQKVDVSLLDSQVSMLTYMAEGYFATGDSPGRMGSRHPNISPYQAFETADGYVVVAVPSEHIWPRFCEAIGRPDLTTDERFETNEQRVINRDTLDSILAGELEVRTTGDLLDRFESHDVPASEVKSIREVFENPQIAARKMQQTVEHSAIGEIEVMGSPMHLSETGASIRRPPPEHGEHTESVLREYGYDESDIEALREAGAL